jgi:hypothetical protein
MLILKSVSKLWCKFSLTIKNGLDYILPDNSDLRCSWTVCQRDWDENNVTFLSVN